ncbi:MAG: acetyl-CoA decarbonylase/synthase complex subunit gamma [Armatimonadetes bacterium]|jgi:acetyl-CoA decarbonylase/synthase complex subunit gamma|nr:acetyl-CoA decarbonylase/synthase complex subunit gamma [Armatimonadota bacterium]
MALTGLDLFKLLPKTNCGECGVPTCMAFAMKLAAKTVELAACPYASEEAKEKIGAASKPPIRLVKIGPPDYEVAVGNETVMFRHEKTFVHPTALAVRFSDTQSAEELAHLTAEVREYCLERVGEQLRLDLALVENVTGAVEPFVAAVKAVAGGTGRGLILKSDNPEALDAALQALEGQRPLIHAATPENAEAMAALALKHKAPLVARAESLDALAALTARLAKLGVQDLVLDVPAENPAVALQHNTVIRKAALKSSFEPLGYPILNFVAGDDLPALVADASTLMCKYASILVIDTLAAQALLPLMMLRQNIYTDPQKPIQVEPNIYPIGEPNENSPVLVTTNFSLTYFIVSGEIENSGVPAHLVIVECEGQSVLTAWAAGKFTGEKIAAFIKASDLESRVETRRLIIPGYVAQVSGELEENLPGWEIVVGPQEAADLGPFLKLQAAA